MIWTAIPTSGATALGLVPNGPLLTITPDGSRIVYRGVGQILVRALDQFEPLALTGLGAPVGLFTAPDGQSVGFFDGATSLKRVAITGGPAVTIVALLDGPPRGATWSADDTIVYATGSRGLKRVSAAGGEVTNLTTPARERGEDSHLWPEFLPDGHTVLFTISALSGGRDAAQIAALDLRTGTQTVLLRGGSHARYVPTGHLVYGASGGLRAIAFDLDRLVAFGTPVPVLGSVATNAIGGIEVAVARNGTLAYLSGASFVPLAHRTLVWVDRQGREEPLDAPPRAYLQPRLSPDGTRVAIVSADEDQDLWIWDVARKKLNQLTFDSALDASPLWMPDSQRLLFSSTRAGASNLYVQAADGSGSMRRLTESPNPQFATGVTPDGTRVVLFEATRAQSRDLRLLTLAPALQVAPLLETSFEERNGAVSLDGRWLAYESNRSGRYEIYVQPFTSGSEGLWKISAAGGVQPLWAPRGGELFYLAPDGALNGVAIDARGGSWATGATTRLLEGRYFTGAGNVGRQYDVTTDGQRFLRIKDDPANADSSTQIIVIQNWFEELKSKVPTK